MRLYMEETFLICPSLDLFRIPDCTRASCLEDTTIGSGHVLKGGTERQRTLEGSDPDVRRGCAQIVIMIKVYEKGGDKDVA